MGMREQKYIPEIHAPAAEVPSSIKMEPSALPRAPGHPRKMEVESSVTEYLNRQNRRPKSLSNSSEPFRRGVEDIPKRVERPQTRQRPMESIALPLMDFENIQIKGRLFNTYIVAETASEVLFIDQHIAEERVLYEKLRKQMEEQGVPSQGLLLPVTIELSPAQVTVLDSALEILARMGFDLEPFGGRAIVVRAVPVVMQSGDVKQIVMDLIDQIATSPDRQDKLKLQEGALIMTACRSAVQAGDDLSDAEVTHLLRELFNTDPPFVCPHGRPIIIRMNRAELEEKFQRK